MQTGTVRMFDSARNYGFVAPDEGNEDLFFHVRSLVSVDVVARGDRVTYETQPSKRKPGKFEAVNVRLADANDAPQPVRLGDAA